MLLLHAGIVLLLFCSACTYQFRGGSGYGPFLFDPDQEWERMEKVISEEMPEKLQPETKLLRSASGSGSSVPPAKKVPEYLVVSSSEDQKYAFKPEKGARPLPDSVKEMLLKTASPPIAAVSRSKQVEALCHVDRLYVRIKREIFKHRDAYKYLKLGSCPVNRGDRVYYYFLYLLTTDCGFNRQSNADQRIVSTVLKYNPTTPVLREMPFDVPIRCNYPRLFHSYKVGFYPTLKGGTVLKALQPKSAFTLTAQDASGNAITGIKSFTLGNPMYFEAKQPENQKSGDKRIYINKCFMTASADRNADPKYTVIDNQGCMVDGKMTPMSKFISGSSKMVQKFSIGAMVFKHKVSSSSNSQQLYMHCDISVGKSTPTQSSKACNYVPSTKKWTALYGDDYVCACCDSTCSTGNSKASRNIVSSHSWKVDLSHKPGYDEVSPRMKFLDMDTFSLEGADMEEHKDYLKYWDHDY